MDKIHNRHIEKIVDSLIELDNNWLSTLKDRGDKMNDIQSIVSDYEMDGDAKSAMEKLKKLLDWESQSG